MFTLMAEKIAVSLEFYCWSNYDSKWGQNKNLFLKIFRMLTNKLLSVKILKAIKPLGNKWRTARRGSRGLLRVCAGGRFPPHCGPHGSILSVTLGRAPPPGRDLGTTVELPAILPGLFPCICHQTCCHAA